MSYTRNAHNIYRTNAVHAGSPAGQVAMLFETAARDMEIAKWAIDHEDFEARFNATERVATICSALRGNLDTSTPATAEMSQVYDAFYARMQYLIMQVNLKNDPDLAQAVSESLREMARTWRQVDHQLAQDAGDTHHQTSVPAA